MNIYEKIQITVYTFHERNKKNCTKLFLGKEEVSEFFKLYNENTQTTYHNKLNEMDARLRFLKGEGEHRLEFQKMKVYRVDDDNYCEVGL